MATRNANAEQARRWRELLMQFEIIRRRRAAIEQLQALAVGGGNNYVEDGYVEDGYVD